MILLPAQSRLNLQSLSFSNFVEGIKESEKFIDIYQ